MSEMSRPNPRGDALPTARSHAEFVQLYRSAMKAMRMLAIEAPMAHAVLYVLLERMNQRNALVVSVETLCKITGKSRSTVSRALSELRRRNYIDVLRAGNIPVIVVNKRVAWTTDTVLREKLAIFDAQVILSAKEQDELTQIDNPKPLAQLPAMLIPPEIGTVMDDEDPTIPGQQDLSI